MLLAGCGLLKISDFGLANVMPSNKVLDTHCGTPQYASPELLTQHASYVGSETDMWSCGVVLFALLCAKLPFADSDLPKLVSLILACRFEIPKDVKLSPDCLSVLFSLLQEKGKNRLSAVQSLSHKWLQLQDSWQLPAEVHPTHCHVGCVGKMQNAPEPE